MRIRIMWILAAALLAAAPAAGAAAQAPSAAARTPSALKLGDDWRVDPAKAIRIEHTADEFVDVWIYWDDDHLYLQYDVHTAFPMGNAYGGDPHSIWNADSIEFALSTPNLAKQEKWIIALTDEHGYQIVTRHPRAILTPGEGVDVLIVPTEFGYRGQVIFDFDHAHMLHFRPEAGGEMRFHIWVNDSQDGVERTRIFNMPGDVNRPRHYHTLIFEG